MEFEQLDEEGIVATLGPGWYFIGDPMYSLNFDTLKLFNKYGDNIFDGAIIVTVPNDIATWYENNRHESFLLHDHFGVLREDKLRQPTGNILADTNIPNAVELCRVGTIIQVHKYIHFKYLYNNKQCTIDIDGDIRTFDFNTYAQPLNRKQLLDELRNNIESEEFMSSLPKLPNVVNDICNTQDITLEERLFQAKHPWLHRIKQWFLHVKTKGLWF